MNLAIKIFKSSILTVIFVSCRHQTTYISDTIAAPIQHDQSSSNTVVQVPEKNTKTIEIISEPPGARIEVNDDYIGNAPCKVCVECDESFLFKRSTTISALPVNQGQQTQSKFFYGDHVLKSLCKQVPSKIFFDMNLVTTPNVINLNLNNKNN